LELTPQAREVLTRAQEEARAMEHSTVEPEHQLLAVIDDPRGVAAGVLADAGVKAEPAREVVRAQLGSGGGRRVAGRVPFSQAAMEAMDAASRVAFGVGSDEIGPEHLLLAMVTVLKGGGAFQIITKLGLDPAVIRFEIKKRVVQPPRPGGGARLGRGVAALGPLRLTHDWQGQAW
jgi:ATP-dependent Clp protease ATP-binding subunit ClpA